MTDESGQAEWLWKIRRQSMNDATEVLVLINFKTSKKINFIYE